MVVVSRRQVNDPAYNRAPMEGASDPIADRLRLPAWALARQALGPPQAASARTCSSSGVAALAS